MLRINEIKLDLFESKDLIKEKIAKKLRMKSKDIKAYEIFKESIDARNQNKIQFVYTVDFSVDNENKYLKKFTFLSKTPAYNYEIERIKKINNSERPIIVGFGPSGIFAALILAESGYKPIVFEMGEKIPERTISVKRFWEEGILNERSNVQFGEGGAGTFSDGKLTTRISDLRCRKVLNEFVEAGAPKEILYKKDPHLGTDKLKGIIIKIRKKIEQLGGEIHFNSKVNDLIIDNHEIKGIVLETGEEYLSKTVTLAIGHSSRDLFKRLYEKNVALEKKPFAVGVRIEHPQQMIDQNQYGRGYLRNILGAASYNLSHKTKNGRYVYTFCMCPGGEVVAASSAKGQVVTNGMSKFNRSLDNANSAILVNVKPDDFEDHPLAGMHFQETIEKKAFTFGGKDYSAPAMYVHDLLNRDNAFEPKIAPSYTPQVQFVDFTEIFPNFIIESIKEGLLHFRNKINNFDRDDAILTAPETRSSSPIRIRRNTESYMSENIKNLFPIGEGSGYSGGIMSSAVDGIKAAEKIMQK